MSEDGRTTTEREDDIRDGTELPHPRRVHMPSNGQDVDTTQRESISVLTAINNLSAQLNDQIATVNAGMHSLAERVTAIEYNDHRDDQRRDPTSAESPRHSRYTSTPASNSRSSDAGNPSWFEHHADDDPELPSWSEGIHVAGSEELRAVSIATNRLLEECCSKSVPNDTRKQWRKKYLAPDADCARCPRLDKPVQTHLPKTVKDHDRNLARLQTFVTDGIGPLVHILEEAQKGPLDHKAVVEATTQALRCVGNASAQISQERRKKISTHLNSDVQDLISDEDQFRTAAPMLFGKQFDKSVEEHVDSVKRLRKTATTTKAHSQPGTSSNRVFQGGRSYQPGRGSGRSQYYQSGNFHRKATRGRYQPYDKDRQRGFHRNGGSSKKSQP